MIGENRGGRVWPIRMRNVGFFFFLGESFNQ